MSKYDSIMNLTRPLSKKHPPMALADRAAQFAPFAALTGYEDAVKEEARLTDSKQALSEEENRDLNQKITWLLSHSHLCPLVTVTYFVPDQKKTGGHYQSHTGPLHYIDTVEEILVFADKTVVSLSKILELFWE